jgi:hypothetical protein
MTRPQSVSRPRSASPWRRSSGIQSSQRPDVELGPWRAWFLLAGLLCLLALGLDPGSASAAPCDPPVQNEIVCENTKPGDAQSEWDVSGAGNPDMQGFATDISVDKGEAVHFKIDTAADVDDYRLDIYRMGYYGGDPATGPTRV